MSTQGVRNAFKALAAANNNLLTADEKDVKKFTMEWAPSAFIDNKKVDQSKGLWLAADRTPVVIPLIGVVDLNKSHLGPYGNLFCEKNEIPARKDLAKCKFTLALTYPHVPSGHVDEDLVGRVANQMFRLGNIQDNAMDALKAGGHPEPKSTTDWVRGEQTDQSSGGWIHVALGTVYVSSVTKVKIRDMSNLSPSKASSSSTLAIKKEDIEDDPKEYHEKGGATKLKHNDLLPCFKENGERLGRTSTELLTELYNGRWVRVDVEMLMWNMKTEGKLVFQLVAKKLIVLNVAPAYAVSGIAYESLSKNGDDDAKAIADEENAKDKPVEDDEGTLSSDGPDEKGKKRSADVVAEEIPGDGEFNGRRVKSKH